MAIANRSCPQCGIPLASNETFCSNCGTQYPDPTPIDPTVDASSPSQSSSNPSLPQIEPTQYAGPSSSSPYGDPYGSSGQSHLPPPATPYGDPPSSYSQSEQQSQSLFGGFAQLSQSKKGPNVGLIIGVIVLLLLLIGGGIFFLTRSKSSTITSHSTPTVAAPSATTSTPQPLFSDNFADNSKGWSTGSGSGFSSIIANNMLSLSEANHKILNNPIPDGNSPAIYTDFSVMTTFTISKADQNDSVGLYVRGDDDLKQGYFIDIFGDNSYDIVKVFPDPNKDAFLVSPTNSSTINSLGQQNKLTVIMKGPKLVVLINDKVVNAISDTAYTSGQIALFAENGRTSNGVKASFTSVVVYPAPAQLPS